MAETYDIAIRLDASDPTSLLSVLNSDGGAYLVVKELENSNPHYHVVLHSKRKVTAVRAALKRAMPELNGNGSYSCTLVRDLAKYQRYMMKGESRALGPEISGANGLMYCDPEWREEMHDAYWDENDEITRKRKKARVYDSVLDVCKETQVSWSNREKIAELYIRELSDRNMPINLFSLKSNINLIQVKLCPGDEAILDLAARCANA